MGIDGSLIGTLQRQLLTSEVSRCDFWGTKARTETSRFKTLPEPLRCRYWLSEHVATGSMAIGSTRS